MLKLFRKSNSFRKSGFCVTHYDVNDLVGLQDEAVGEDIALLTIPGLTKHNIELKFSATIVSKNQLIFEGGVLGFVDPKQ